MQAVNLILATLDNAAVDIREVRAVIGGGGDLDQARRRANALHAAMPTDWQTFEALATAKGYRSLTAMAQAVGREVGAIRKAKARNRVNAAIMEDMARAPDAPPPRKHPPGSSPENLDAKERQHPMLHQHFAEEALRRTAAGAERLDRRAIVDALRERGEYRGNDHIADRLALHFVLDHPEHLEKFR